MRFTLTALAIAAALATGSFTARVSGSTGPIPLNCDRACLEGLIDQYLAAVVAHDPSKLPLSKDVKYSENYQMLEVGDGFWKTASGIGNYKHVFADPEFVEVFVDTSVDECARRDVKGLYAKAFSGEIKEFTGVSDPYEAPPSPDVHIRTEEESAAESAGRVLAELEARGLVGRAVTA